MYLIDPNTTLKFGIRKVEGRYFPVEIKEESEIKDGQVVFSAKPYTIKEVIIFNELSSELAKYDFIKERTSCNFPMDNMLPQIIYGVNIFVMGKSVMQEEDEKLFM